MKPSASETKTMKTTTAMIVSKKFDSHAAMMASDDKWNHCNNVYSVRELKEMLKLAKMIQNSPQCITHSGDKTCVIFNKQHTKARAVGSFEICTLINIPVTSDALTGLQLAKGVAQ